MTVPPPPPRPFLVGVFPHLVAADGLVHPFWISYSNDLTQLGIMPTLLRSDTVHAFVSTVHRHS